MIPGRAMRAAMQARRTPTQAHQTVGMQEPPSTEVTTNVRPSTPKVQRLLFWLALAGTTLGAAACILNPQPLPPEASDGRDTTSSGGGTSLPTAGDGGSTFEGEGGAKSDAATGIDGGLNGDAAVDSGGDAGDASATDDAGDAGN